MQRVRWTPASGELDHVFDDELVCASVGVSAALLRKIEPFPTATLVPYDPGYLAGWTVERYQIDLVDAAERSRQEMDAKLRALCAQRCPATRTAIWWSTRRSAIRRFKHILVPVWLMTYIYGRKVVSGGGQRRDRPMAGDRPWSWIKVTLLVIVALIVFLFAT